MVKIAIPSNGPGGLEDIVASRFARAAKFTIVEVDEKGNVTEEEKKEEISLIELLRKLLEGREKEKENRIVSTIS